MSAFAPAYNKDNNHIWLDQLLEDIVGNSRNALCARTGQDYDDDLVDDPNDDTVSDDGRSNALKLSRHTSSPVPHEKYRKRSPSVNDVPERKSSARSMRATKHRLPSPSVGGPAPDSPPATRSSHPSLPAPVASLRSPGWRNSPRRIEEDSAVSEFEPSYMEQPSVRWSNQGSVRNARLSLQPSTMSGISDAWEHSTAVSSDFEKSDLEKTSQFNDSQESLQSGNFDFPVHPGVRPLEKNRHRPTKSLVEDPETQYPGPLPLALIVAGVCLSVFIISLDRSIITTATPKITNQFHSDDDIGWYGAAYLLTAASFQPLYGRVYIGFNTKSTFLSSLIIFEIGSLICGVSPSSSVLIVGRAIQGLGSAGVLTGAFVIVTHSVPLVKRPVYFAAIGILFGVGALIGPLLGGVFSDTISWRWCFYINLPIGGFTFATVLFFFKHKSRSPATQLPWIKRVLALDLIGNAILLGACVMLFLALQYTEQAYAWNSSRVIGLLVGFGLTVITFITWLWYKGDAALLPPRIMLQRTVAASCLAAFFTYACLLVHTYYLPIWFEAVKGDSAIHAGVNMIPYMCANALFSLMAGIVVSKNGLFAPPAIIGYAIGTIGTGLLSTLQVDTSSARWIGYEILTSAGLGMAIQQGFTAVQTALPTEEVPMGTAAVIASQSLGGAIFVSIGNTLLQNHLLDANNAARLQDVDVRVVLTAGATAFRKLVPAKDLPVLLDIYNSALRPVFIAAIPMAGLAFVSSLFLEWNSVKTKKEKVEQE